LCPGSREAMPELPTKLQKCVGFVNGERKVILGSHNG